MGEKVCGGWGKLVWGRDFDIVRRVGKIGLGKGIWDGVLGGENLMMAWEFLDVKVGAKDFDF